MSADSDQRESAGRTRSPAYPAFSLKKAIERLGVLYKEERRNLVHTDVVLKHWGYDPKSSNGLRAIAALKQFGLIEDQGKKDDRQVRLSELGFELVMPESEGNEEHLAHLRQAALRPVLHKAIWEEYNGDLPSDAALRRYLIKSKNFNDSFVDPFVRQFRSTIAFAKLSKADTIEQPEGQSGDEDEDMETPKDRPKDKNPGTMGGEGFSPPKPPSGLRDFPLYTSASKGALYVPGQLTKKDFELLRLQIQNSLAVIEATAVVDDEQDGG